MNEKIQSLTPYQQADIEPTIRKWRDSYTVTTDRDKQEKVITELYQRFVTHSDDVPIIIHVESPLAAIVLSAICQPLLQDISKKIHNATVKPFSDSLRTSLNESLRASLNDSLDTSLRASLSTSLSASLDDSLRASLRYSLSASLDASLSDSLRASLSASLRDSLRASLDDSLRDSLDASLDASRRSLIVGYWIWHGWWRSGSSVVDFLLRHFPDDLRLKWDKKDAELWRDCGKYLGTFLPYSKNICIVVDSPTRATFNASGVLDYDHGKALEYADGYGLYAIKGVVFAEKEYWQIVNQEMTGHDIAKLASDGVFTSDQSEAAISMLGAENLLKEMNAVLIATGNKYEKWRKYSEDDDADSTFCKNQPTKLYQVDNFRGTGKTEYCILMEHPSVKGKKYIEWVPPEIGERKDADLAQAAAFNITKQEYINAVEA